MKCFKQLELQLIDNGIKVKISVFEFLNLVLQNVYMMCRYFKYGLKIINKTAMNMHAPTYPCLSRFYLVLYSYIDLLQWACWFHCRSQINLIINVYFMQDNAEYQHVAFFFSRFGQTQSVKQTAISFFHIGCGFISKKKRDRGSNLFRQSELSKRLINW